VVCNLQQTNFETGVVLTGLDEEEGDPDLGESGTRKTASMEKAFPN
jgi:hypothetical protein